MLNRYHLALHTAALMVAIFHFHSQHGKNCFKNKKWLDSTKQTGTECPFPEWERAKVQLKCTVSEDSCALCSVWWLKRQVCCFLWTWKKVYLRSTVFHKKKEKEERVMCCFWGQGHARTRKSASSENACSNCIRTSSSMIAQHIEVSFTLCDSSVMQNASYIVCLSHNAQWTSVPTLHGFVTTEMVTVWREKSLKRETLIF